VCVCASITSSIPYTTTIAMITTDSYCCGLSIRSSRYLMCWKYEEGPPSLMNIWDILSWIWTEFHVIICLAKYSQAQYNSVLVQIISHWPHCSLPMIIVGLVSHILQS